MKIFFSVGEPSGDLHGANLIRELQKRRPDCEFVGYGGPRMAAVGCALHEDLTKLVITLQQSHHALTVKFYHLALLCSACSKEGTAAREHIELAGKLAWAMNGDEGLNGPAGTHYFDLAGDHHKERYDAVSLLDEHIATLHRSHVPPTPCNSTNLC